LEKAAALKDLKMRARGVTIDSPAVSGPKRQAVNLRGELTGMVLCPQRMAHIAAMRCGEYQEQFGCQFGCANAVTQAQIAALKLELRQLPLQGRHVQRAEYGSRPLYDCCINCGNPKHPNPSPRCQQCAMDLRRHA
jgi:hypothetical protein